MKRHSGGGHGAPMGHSYGTGTGVRSAPTLRKAERFAAACLLLAAVAAVRQRCALPLLALAVRGASLPLPGGSDGQRRLLRAAVAACCCKQEGHVVLEALRLEPTTTTPRVFLQPSSYPPCRAGCVRRVRGVERTVQASHKKQEYCPLCACFQDKSRAVSQHDFLSSSWGKNMPQLSAHGY